jgi:hypothetical protein
VLNRCGFLKWYVVKNVITEIFSGEAMKSFKELYEYLSSVRQLNKVDIHSIVNTTLVANPYISKFSEDFLFNTRRKEQFSSSFFVNALRYYGLNSIRILMFLRTLIYFKIFFQKPILVASKNDVVLDLYVNIESVSRDGMLCEKYFQGLYSVLREENRNYIFIPRLIGFSNNPIKAHKQLVSFFKIVSQDHNQYIFEFGMFSFKNFIELLGLYFSYPFKTLRLFSKKTNRSDLTFNFHLKKDISKQSIIPFTRYILGKNISNFNGISRIYSWSEFQVTERAFNFAIRKNSDIKITACQFLVTYPAHFNMHIQDIDEDHGSAPNKVLVNGAHYLLKRVKINYQVGVSLRYKDIFRYQPQYAGSKTLVLGSYSAKETTNILKMVVDLDGVLFKGHPLVDNQKFSTFLNDRITTTQTNIYDLFPQSALIIGGASGSLAEAIACGVSVLVIAKENELVTNPLTEIGKGKMWDIAYNSTDILVKSAELVAFRNMHKDEIINITSWYRSHLFVEPTKEKIKQTFELN